MSSSSGDEYHTYRHMFPLHDAAEAGDMEALVRMLRPLPPRKLQVPLVTLTRDGSFGGFSVSGHDSRPSDKASGDAVGDVDFGRCGGVPLLDRAVLLCVTPFVAAAS